MDINTCFETTSSYHTIAYYSHLVPVFLIIILAVFVSVKSGFSFLSKLFSIFSALFSLWLLGDVVLWTQNDYNLVTTVWAPLDYINTLFYLFGAYFFAVVVKEKDISIWEKIILLALSVPAWWITASGQSITTFNQPVCEAYNSDFLTQYKLIVEVFSSVYILILGGYYWKKGDKSKRKQILVVASALILFFAVFSVTEYISSETGVYEINLYSLFVLPVFLFMITYSITSLEIFKLRLIGSQLLAYTLIAMVGSQFFFLENSTSKILTTITFLLSLGFGGLLVRSARREAQAREQIEKLAKGLQTANARLKELDVQKTEFVSFATHQLRSPLASMKGYTSLILDGDLGKVDDKVRDAVQTIFTSASTLTNVVDDYLNISRIELGTMKYDMKKIDFKDLLKSVVAEQKPNIEAKGLAFNVSVDEKEMYMVKADSDKFKQVVMNIIDNSVKYTPAGSLAISLVKKSGKVVFEVSDTGVGIDPRVMPKLFQKFSRAPDAGEANIHGTGLGLFIARQIMEAHGGRVWAESAGVGKGSQFYIELPEAK